MSYELTIKDFDGKLKARIQNHSDQVTSHWYELNEMGLPGSCGKILFNRMKETLQHFIEKPKES